MSSLKTTKSLGLHAALICSIGFIGSSPRAMQPPGGAAVGYVLRTGWHSSQGTLMRTIVYASERMTGNTREAFVFILFLLCFAVAAAGYVLRDGLNDPSRSRFKLAIPFVGKDVPSRASEFSHPDIVIGFTILAYRYASSHHLFSSRTWASSSGVKSLTILKVLRISSGVFPLIIDATAAHVKSKSGFMSI